MKTYQTQNLRNVAIVGGTGSGKTTLAEAFAFESKLIDRKGTVEAGNTLSDNSEVEQEQGRSIFPSVIYTEFAGHKFNFIDTPGVDDLCGGVFTAYKVCDLAALVINGHNGFDVGSEIHSRYAAQAKMPVVGIVNQLDKEGTTWEKAIESIVAGSPIKPVVVQYPANPGVGFDAIIDVLTMKMYKAKDENGNQEELEIPASEMDRAMDYHNELLEAAAINDEALMEKFFETNDLSADEIRQGLRDGVAGRDFMPIFCCSAKKSFGLKRIMEFIINVLPDPKHANVLTDVEGNEVKCDSEAPTSIFIFRNAVEQHVGEVSYFRVVTGKLTEGMELTNRRNGNKEKISQIFAVAGKKREKVSEMVAGEIGCTVKLKGTKANDTLGVGEVAAISKINFPAPRYRAAVRALDQNNEEKLGELLNRLKQEDPTYIVEYSKELKQTIVQCQGEMHINLLKTYLNKNKIEVEFLAPRIPYRETITKVAAANYRHRKQSGGSGQFGEVHMVVEPYYEGMPEPKQYKVDGRELLVNIKGKEEFDLEWGGKLIYYNAIVGGAIDARFMPAILKGIKDKLNEGPLTGSYARDIRVVIYDGKMHPVDSNEISFVLAARNAFKEAFRNAGPKILEPIYSVEVLVPSENVGDIMSDLTSNRRAQIMGMNAEGSFSRLSARVPLAELYRYSTTLSAMTLGRASYTMEFASYEQVPADVQDKLLKAYQEEDKDE
jgi:elongation factor G